MWRPRLHLPPGGASLQPELMLYGQHMRCPLGPSKALPMSSLGTFGPRPLFLLLVFPFPLPFSWCWSAWLVKTVLCLAFGGRVLWLWQRFCCNCCRSQRQEMKGYGWPGENHRQVPFQWKFSCCISLQSGNGFSYVHKCSSVGSEDLNQRGFCVSRWRLFLHMLEQLTVEALKTSYRQRPTKSKLRALRLIAWKSSSSERVEP